MHSYVSQMHPSRSAKYFLIYIESSVSEMLPLDEGSERRLPSRVQSKSLRTWGARGSPTFPWTLSTLFD